MSKARQDNQLLLHMAALLFELAEMALLANYLPFANRLVLFAVMRQGDAAARKIAIRAGTGAAFIIPHNLDSDDEALRLAIGFRILAVALLNLGLRQQAMLAFSHHSCRKPTDAAIGSPVSNVFAKPVRSARKFARDGPSP